MNSLKKTTITWAFSIENCPNNQSNVRKLIRLCLRVKMYKKKKVLFSSLNLKLLEFHKMISDQNWINLILQSLKHWLRRFVVSERSAFGFLVWDRLNVSRLEVPSGWTYTDSPWVSDLPDSRRAGHGPCLCLHLNRGREEQFRDDNEVDRTHTHKQTILLYEGEDEQLPRYADLFSTLSNVQIT